MLIVLYGSRARGDNHPDSDIDLFFIGDDLPDDKWLAMWNCEADQWKIELADTLSVEVDMLHIVSNTSDQAIKGLFESSKFLYLREPKNSINGSSAA